MTCNLNESFKTLTQAIIGRCMGRSHERAIMDLESQTVVTKLIVLF